MARALTPRICLVAVLATGATALLGATAHANTVIVGSQLTAPGFAPAPVPPPPGTATTRTNFVLPAPAVGYSTVDGTVRSWRFIGTGGPFTPRVLRATGGFSLTGAGVGAPANATAPGTVSGPFTISIPIKAGDFFGVDALNPSGIHIAPTVGSTFFSFTPSLPEGGSGAAPTPPVTTGELAVEATVRYCLMPKLKGQTGKAARQALTTADCTLGNVNKSSKRRPVKSVLSQSVKAGTSISDTAPVDFKISKKSKPKPTKKKKKKKN